MSIRSVQNMKAIQRLIFFLNQQKPLFKPRPAPLPWNSTHPSQNARINTSVINLDSCKKRAPKHKKFKSNGELGIGI